MSTIYIPANGPEDWKQFLAQPDRQWRDGYSAEKLAVCRQNADGFPLNIKKLFHQSDIPLFNNIEYLRNVERFPKDFMSDLTKDEWSDLRCQFGISSWGGSR